MSRHDAERRRDAIRRRVAAMVTAGLPADWQQWDAAKTAQFKADYRELFTIQSIDKLLIPAGRPVTLYGRGLAEIDPGATQ